MRSVGGCGPLLSLRRTFQSLLPREDENEVRMAMEMGIDQPQYLHVHRRLKRTDETALLRFYFWMPLD